MYSMCNCVMKTQFISTSCKFESVHENRGHPETANLTSGRELLAQRAKAEAARSKAE
eukprot:COSAG06_NODE_6089_length_3116_cov_3.167716_5_plen_57_part_00